MNYLLTYAKGGGAFFKLALIYKLFDILIKFNVIVFDAHDGLRPVEPNRHLPVGV